MNFRAQPKQVWITAFAAVIAFTLVGGLALFFIATALSVSVGAASGGQKSAILMAVALILCATFLARDSHHERPKIGLLEPLKALKHPVLLRTSVGAALYTAAFFTVLAWSPFALLMLVMAVPSKPLLLAATFVSHLAQPFVVAAVLCAVAAVLLTFNRTDTREVPTEVVIASEQLVG